MTRFGSALLVVVAAGWLHAEDWTRELKDGAKRDTLHDAAQRVQGDSGKWNDNAALQHLPSLTKKPPKTSLDAWADLVRTKKLEVTDQDQSWLLLRSEQLDDNDRLWIERIERRGNQFTVVANLARWQGKYFRNFTYYPCLAVNLGKLDPGKYEAKWLLRPLAFQKFDGDGKAIDGNWPRDARPVDQKPAELRLTFQVNK